MANVLPYQCEYARSKASHCRLCKEIIAAQELRLAQRVRRGHYDGLQPDWYHYECFFEKNTPADANQFMDIDMLRYEDQMRIIDSVNSKLLFKKPSRQSGGKKRKVDEIIVKNSDFSVEYAKSGRSRCTFCTQCIPNKGVRIGKKDSESEDARQFGSFFRWFCVNCFITCRDDVKFYDGAEAFLGFEELDDSDQRSLRQKIKVSVKKFEKDSEQEEIMITETKPIEKPHVPVVKNLSVKLQQQSDKLYAYVAELSAMKVSDLNALAMANDQYEEMNTKADDVNYVEKDRVRKIHIIADALAFGRPRPCPECKSILRFKNFRYECTGSLDEWTKCHYKTDKPLRTPVVIPEELKKVDFLKKYKPTSVFSERLVEPSLREKFIEHELSHMKKDIEGLIKKEKGVVADVKKPLSDIDIGFLGKEAKGYKDKAVELGARIGKGIFSSTALVFCSEDEFQNRRIAGRKAAEKQQTPVISVSFLVSPPLQWMDLFEAIQPYVLTQWDKSDEDVKEHLKACSRAKVTEIFEGKSGSSKSGSETTMVVKGGGIVHPSFTKNPNVHVLRRNGCLYSAKLHMTDLDLDSNSFYIIQILQDDFRPHLIYLFKTWGRVGTVKVDKKEETIHNVDLAISIFETEFFKKTDNQWSERKNFKRKCGFYYYTEDMDEEMFEDLQQDFSESKLNPAVLSLLCKLFDRNQMEATMREFKIDLEKMPLGKLNKNQLLEACSTLKGIGEMIDYPDKLIHSRLRSLCEKYYTLVPHSFGNCSITLLNTKKQIEEEMEMLESLLEMEIAFSIMTKKKDDTQTEKKEDPFDHHYRMLKTDLQPVDSESEEYKMVETYLKNTHASTHQSYKFQLKDVFVVKREGEEKRFKPFENDPNRKLLWHGSRMTNYVGILSQGLRIAPPEAPASGYMFGKGVYFADSASKSANYCFNMHNNGDGLLMLSEVALGTSQELLQAQNITKLDSGFLSVKGCGRSVPDPTADITLENGCVVPTGKLIVDTSKTGHTLQYNEYIVYDVAQIKQRYLVNVEFLTDAYF